MCEKKLAIHGGEKAIQTPLAARHHFGAEEKAACNRVLDEAITAGREYSRHKMNQCIAVTIYGISIMSELKTLIVFAAFAYVSLMLYRISKKFPKKA